MKRIIVLLAIFLLPQLVYAKEATPLAEDPVIEARLMTLSADLRCLVCQNQSLAASDSDFAHDVRREMRTMMKQGKSDDEIIDFLVQRFGDFILFKPPVKSYTALLWFGPLLLLVVGATVLILVLRRRTREGGEVAVLSAEDHRRAEALLTGRDDSEAHTDKGQNA